MILGENEILQIFSVGFLLGATVLGVPAAVMIQKYREREAKREFWDRWWQKRRERKRRERF